MSFASPRCVCADAAAGILWSVEGRVLGVRGQPRGTVHIVSVCVLIAIGAVHPTKPTFTGTHAHFRVLTWITMLVRRGIDKMVC